MATSPVLPPAWADVPSQADPCLADVFGAALACAGLPLGSEVARARLSLDSEEGQLLIILVDGLGYVPLMSHLGHASTLRSVRNDIVSLHTIVPSTTAAAITSFGTGEKPGKTRMVGYAVARGDSVMNLLAFENGPDPLAWQECPTYFERLNQQGVKSAVISPPTFAGSGLTKAALRGARHVAGKTWDERASAALRELKKGTQVVYLYWSEIDHTGHGHAVSSWEWSDALEAFDAGLGRLLLSLPRNVRTVLTADHGMIDIDHGALIDLADRPDLADGVRILAGETRAVHIHTEAGRESEVIDRWKNELSDVAWVLGCDESAPLLGEGPGNREIGAGIAFFNGRAGLVDSRSQKPEMIAMPGVHGSLTEAEMRIPLIRLS